MGDALDIELDGAAPSGGAAECLGTPTALIMRKVVRIRGEPREWPTTRGEWPTTRGEWTELVTQCGPIRTG